MTIRNKPIRKKKKKDNKMILKSFSLFVISFCLLAIIYNFYQGNEELKKMEVRIVELKKEINQLSQNKNKLEEQISDVHSKHFIERVAREELGLVKDGEILYIVVEEKGEV